ncbi:MAG TPA: MBL fold metallo-hydrolase [Planctomycetota bacterium]|nr:MBL fold metallo-hydrolase [Planctomycetota bacterium]
MRITFHGAARTVTGSMHLLEVGGTTVLLDAGLYQGRRDEARERNTSFPESAVRADACLLSHAHMDHSGSLPTLVKRGFAGRIHCTKTTVELCDVLLRDSAGIQQRDFEFLVERGVPVTEPLYALEDVERTMGRFAPARYGTWIDVVPGVRARFLDAGHILGSAVTQIEATEGSATRRVSFTGDLGRRGMPILRDPEALPPSDVVITESTYGDREHPKLADTEGELAAIVRERARRDGRILIPAFSVGRTQNLIYSLYRIYKRGDCPRVPIFVDSPLSTRVTQIVARHPECFDDEARAVLGPRGEPFAFPELRYVETVEESKSLNDRRGPFIVIAASGMAEGGRILHHLRHGIGDPTTLVLIVGFQAEHTLGRRLVEHAPRVRIFGEELDVRAEVRTMNAMSAHADRSDLLHYLAPVARSCGKIFVVHGEPNAADALASGLRAEGCGDVRVPSPGDSFGI